MASTSDGLPLVRLISVCQVSSLPFIEF